jgi:hypothetical protein
MLSIERQIDLVRARFPQFCVVRRVPHAVTFRGRVRPVESGPEYTLLIKYALPSSLLIERPLKTYYPKVYVQDPDIRLATGHPTNLLPHVWFGDNEPPHLCLFKADSGEWDYSCAIADTTIPDACEWLYFFQAWLATGRWHGGGAEHPTNEEVRYDYRQTLRWHTSSVAVSTALAA